MDTIVADTHALVWQLTAPGRLGAGARRAFQQVDAGRWLCYVPVAALIEMALLYERGRLRASVATVLQTLAPHGNYAVLALDVEQVIAFASLSAVRDPMDRLIAAAARATGSRLVSRDTALDNLDVVRVWD